MPSVKNSDYILSINNVNKQFPGVKALDNVSLNVKKGVVHAIVGENGAGKSTLMKILSGVYTKDSGTIVFDGEIIEKTTPSQSMAKGLAIIYQELNLVNTMSVGENVFLGRFSEMGGMRGVQKKAQEILDSIGSKVNARQKVGELSVSEKQMVEIAKALSFESKLIIMDEPSSSLTNEEMSELTNIIRRFKSEGISILYISHKLEEIFEFCDCVTIMRDGQIIETKNIEEITRAEMVAKMIGREIDQEYPEKIDTVGDVLLEVENINTNKLSDISFNLHKGEILGLVGLVGAGRTEIIRAIVGADKVKGHKLILEGEEIQIRNSREARDAGLAFIPEDRKIQGLILPFSVEENIALASLDDTCPGGLYNSRKQNEMAERQIESLNVKTPSPKTPIVNLSGGNQQKCIIGRWLERDPKILFLDEPTRGIDVGAKYEIYLLIQEIVKRGGAVVLVSSEFPEVLNLSHRVLAICDGRINGEFNPDTTSPEEIMSCALGNDTKKQEVAAV
ncbi:MAG: sugar ABC transporter ATP-binding protein [Saccharofermentanales bacterium]